MKPVVHAFVFSILTLVMAMTIEAGQNGRTIEYALTPGVPNSHLIEVQITYTPPTAVASVDFAIPAWRPGRYKIQNYARNVREFAAVNERNQRLKTEKIDKNTWRVNGQTFKQITVRYKVYANVFDAGSTLLNEDELYWNGTNLLMYVVGHKDQPTRLQVNVPPSWRIATGLQKTREPNVFLAANYHVLADAPGIASPTLEVVSFDHDGARYFLAFQGEVEYDRRELADNLRRTVVEALKIFGKAPFSEYWFLFHVLPDARYHGVEHLNSTSITVPSATFTTGWGLNRFYSISTHEFFHVWNVKRLYPQVLASIDYSQEIYTRNLWFAEGITTYYDDLLCKRAGLVTVAGYLDGLAGNITTQQNSVGRKLTSAAQASFDEWLTPDDAANVETDIYTKGALLGLLLDMAVRHRTDNQKTLDDVMRYLYATYAQKGIGFPEDGIQKACEAVTGSSFAEFFEAYVAGVKELPYRESLDIAGVDVVEGRTIDTAESVFGVTFGGDEKQVTLAQVRPDEAGFRAGLDKGDILAAIEFEQVTAASLPVLCRKHKPGEQVKVHVFRRGRLRELSVTLQESTSLRYEVRVRQNLTTRQQKVFNSWLNEPSNK
ncbi:MAG: M61 family metallopeptidase [Acidobacteria bacterium]|nr:M61 family metallopeptidase [Acidobacteriota bacterium]